MENVSLVGMNIAGTPTATPVTPRKTKPTKCKKKVVKPDGLGIFRQKMEEVNESTHTLSTRVATFFDACRSAVLGPFHVVLNCGGKGSCSESVMTAAARMALTFLWHGSYGGVSRLGPLRRALSDMVVEQHLLIFSASALQSLPFEDGAVPKHHRVSITLSSNGPHQTRQIEFIVECFCSR